MRSHGCSRSTHRDDALMWKKVTPYRYSEQRFCLNERYSCFDHFLYGGKYMKKVASVKTVVMLCISLLLLLFSARNAADSYGGGTGNVWPTRTPASSPYQQSLLPYVA